MVVTVLYEGVPIIKGAPANEEAGGLFVACEFPMPIGTALHLELAGAEPRRARVVRVLEGRAPAGMAVAWDEAVPAPPAPIQTLPPTTTNGESRKNTLSPGKRKRRR